MEAWARCFSQFCIISNHLLPVVFFLQGVYVRFGLEAEMLELFGERGDHGGKMPQSWVRVGDEFWPQKQGRGSYPGSPKSRPLDFRR